MICDRKLIKHTLTDKGFSEMMIEVEKKVAPQRKVMLNYFGTKCSKGMITEEIDKIAEAKRRQNKSGITDIKLEMLLNEINNEIASNPSVEQCEKLRQRVINYTSVHKRN